MKVNLLLLKKVLKLADKSALIPLGLTTARSTRDKGIHKKGIAQE